MKEVSSVNPFLANQLSQLLHINNVKKDTENLLAELAQIKKVEQKKKPSIINKIFDTANKIIIVSQTNELLKPIVHSTLQLLNTYLIKQTGTSLPESMII